MFKVICSTCQHLKVQSQNEMHVHLYLWTRRSWAPLFENSSVVIAHLNVLKIHCDFPYFWSLRLLFSKNIYCCSCCHGFCFFINLRWYFTKTSKTFYNSSKTPPALLNKHIHIRNHNLSKNWFYRKAGIYGLNQKGRKSAQAKRHLNQIK